MGRKSAFINPSVLATKAKRPKWYIRISLGQGKESPRYLGPVDSMSKEDAEHKARTIIDGISASRAFKSNDPTVSSFSELADRTDQQPNSLTLGPVAELIVAADMLRRGYEVFRPISHAASCDIIAIKGRVVIRLEVKSSAIRRGKFTCSFLHNARKFDMAAIVADHKIYYILANELTALLHPRIPPDNDEVIGALPGADGQTGPNPQYFVTHQLYDAQSHTDEELKIMGKLA